jgi:hypothetical protein
MTSEVFIAIPVSAARRTDLLRTRIKKAYRRKALELHPDRNYGDVENARERGTIRTVIRYCEERLGPLKRHILSIMCASQAQGTSWL